MKTINFFTYAFLAMSLILTSCSGDDGEDGLDGVTGATGTTGNDGADGNDGTNGTDGNANVETFIFDISSFEGSADNITVPQITQDVIDNDVVLTYVTSLNGLNNVLTSYQVPGTLRDNTTNEVFFAEIEQFPGNVFSGNLSFIYYNLSDASAHPILTGQFDELKVIIIESTSTTGRSSQSFSKETVNAELTAAGIDINNYDEVIAYYGL